MPSGTDVRDGTSRSLGAATHRFRNGFTCELSPDEVSGEGIAGSRRVDHARDGRDGEVKDALMRHNPNPLGSSLDHHDLIAGGVVRGDPDVFGLWLVCKDHGRLNSVHEVPESVNAIATKQLRLAKIQPKFHP